MRKIIGATVALALSGAIWACSSDSNKSNPGPDGSVSSGGTAGTGGTSSTGGAKASGGTVGSTGGTVGSTGGTTSPGADGGPDSGLDGGSFPAAPTLGDQIDRMGRAGVNTALTDPFDIVAATTEDAVKDSYNAASDPTKWGATFVDDIKTNLAIIDGLDGVCGNQFAAGKGDAGTNQYDALAAVLADDELYLKTDATTCGVYLGVEANATKIIPNADCGGRTLTEDVIDETYSLLAIGATSGVTDGVPYDKTGQTATFPFLAPPQ